jgi:maltooligosyltrehalose trehalohydrolase
LPIPWTACGFISHESRPLPGTDASVSWSGNAHVLQGQNSATAPFFFADQPELVAGSRGKTKFLSQFPSLAASESIKAVDDPVLESTWARCRLDLSERERCAAAYRLHKDLLRLRREEAALKPQDQRWFDGAVLSDQALVLRYFGETEAGDRLLLVNLAPIDFESAARTVVSPAPRSQVGYPVVQWELWRLWNAGLDHRQFGDWASRHFG